MGSTERLQFRIVPRTTYGTKFARGPRAILDADRHLYEGRHVRAIKTVFRPGGDRPVE